ncbi:MAG: site-specific recombinase [Aeromicrobium sp.]|nr:site-specific recombinase [Burkholderiales bacterium]
MTENRAAISSTKLSRSLNDMVDANADPVEQFIALIDALRPRDAGDHALANARFTQLCEAIESDDTRRIALRTRLIALFAGRRQASFFADSGILPSTGFFSELWRRIVQRVLPAITDKAYLKDCVSLIFHCRDDYEWLGSISLELKLRFWQSLRMDEVRDEQTLLESFSQMLDAADHLATRIGAMGLEPELVRLYPRMDERDSPFLALAVETHQLAASYRSYLIGGASPVEDEQQLLVLVAQCNEVIVRVRARAATVGTSLSVTYLLRRLMQSLQRLESLVRILSTRHEVAQTSADELPLIERWVEFLGDAIEGEARGRGIRTHISRTIGLLALRITDNASRTGEHYITSTRSEYFEMWRSAMGAGFIVAFMAVLKIYSASATLPPLGYALAYSLNYSSLFMLMHVLHLTLATKQPAMTASAIAGAISEIRGRMKDLEKLATVVTDVIRSQIAAILGNVLVALPTAMLLGLLIARITGKPFMDAEKAQHLLHAISPFDSLALFYAAIAGVCLFLAGLISGYYDNLAAYERIRERVENIGWLKALIGEDRLHRFAAYLDDNLGALAGNFFFGIMLGTMGTIGFMTGLPLDVAHVTISSAYFGLALVALDFSVNPATIGNSLAGIALIGLVNLSVSFTLALWVAVRARGVSFSQAGGLIAILFGRLRANWKQFVWPERVPVNAKTP